MQALVFGATGLIGSSLMEQLTGDIRFTRVTAFVRSEPENRLEGAEYRLFDYSNWSEISGMFASDAVVFCCVGTTRSKTPDYDTYRYIDYGIPVKLAELSAQGNCEAFCVVSSLGASAASNNFYLKLKGEMEEEVARLAPRRYYLMRPSLLLGVRKESRPAEWMGKVLGRVVSPLFVGTLRRYRPIHAETVAKAMIGVVLSDLPSGAVENEQISELAQI